MLQSRKEMAILIAVAMMLCPPLAAVAQSPGAITVFQAQKVITMDSGWPDGQFVAVRDGKVLSVGRTMGDLKPWLTSTYTLDTTFQGKVLLPGFIEAHGHPLLGGLLLSRPLVSYMPTALPYGPEFPGVRTIDGVAQIVRDHLAKVADNGQPVIFWGYDMVAMGRHLSKTDIDGWASDRPVIVWDASEHFVYANSAAMKRAGITKDALKINGVGAGPDGEPNGQFLGVTAASSFIDPQVGALLTPEAATAFMKFAIDLHWKNGVTTTSEMALGVVAGTDSEVPLFEAFFNDPSRPVRAVAVVDVATITREKGGRAVAFAKSLESRSTDRLIYKGAKFFADDSYLSMGMQVDNPGYTDGRKGIWITRPEDMVGLYRPWWQAGFHIHTHTNGNASNQAVVAALEQLQAEKPRLDHRFTFQHFGISTPEQVRRVKALGGVASLNPYYVYTRGELSAPLLGTDRAYTAARLKTLVDAGVPTALHTDMPVGPPRPLEEIWIAVNRFGYFSKAVLGPAERVSALQALRMVTIDAAFSLGIEDKVGSIAPGKFADFTVLEADPLAVPVATIRDIKVWGTVLGGRKFPVTDIKPGGR
jgi:predicted amidohydrolase YtcJ